MSEAVPLMLAQQDYHLQYLIHGHHQRAALWVEEQGESAPQLAAWLSAYLKLPIRPDWLAHLSPAQERLWRGWRAYYAGNLAAADELLQEAWRGLSESHETLGQSTDAALGLGKVYTRTGHWQAARGWLLKSLQLARDAGRQFDIIRGYGALGELLLRAGYPREAHACMSTAYHLLPPGSGQQAKQLNYLASSLMRNGAELRAESLLMTSLFMAMDQDDTDSRWHALARLQFLSVETREAGKRDALHELAEYIPGAITPAAAGFAYLGRALHHWGRDIDAAISSLHEAAKHFSHPLPMEQAWTLRLLSAATETAYVPPDGVLQCIQLAPCEPPATTSVVDDSWAAPPIPDENGFGWLATQPNMTALGDILEQRRCFFI